MQDKHHFVTKRNILTKLFPCHLYRQKWRPHRAFFPIPLSIRLGIPKVPVLTPSASPHAEEPPLTFSGGFSYHIFISTSSRICTCNIGLSKSKL